MLSAPVSAQLLQGSITGNVTDPTGSAVPDAEVTVINTQTGNQRVARTNEAGQYSFPTVPAGLFDVTVSKEGFRSSVRKGVEVAINSVTRANVTLQLGQVSEQVTVSAEAATLQADRAEVRAEVTQKQMRNLPVPLGRNYQMLIGSLPGVSVPENAHSVPSNPSRAVRFSVNGTSRSNNNTRIDGASQTNVWLPHMTAYTPALESIETVNVVSNSFDAEQGLAGGAAINLAIKSGTNDIHGSGFWYNNNHKFNAYPYFSDRGNAKPKFLYNQFGGTIGGPIKKNKVFYFVSYEGTRERTNEQRFVDVPTAAMRRGDLSASPNPIYDPNTGDQFSRDGAGRMPFAGNQIPLSRFSRPTTVMVGSSAWPLPNFPGSGSLGINRNYLGSGKYLFDRDTLDTKVTMTHSDKATSFARFSYLDYRMDNPQVFGAFGGSQLHRTNSNPGNGFGFTASGTWSTTYVASPTLVFDGYFGFTWQDTNVAQVDLDQNIGRDVLGIPGTNGTRQFEGGWPRLQIDGWQQLGISNNFMPYFRSDPQWQGVLNGNWTKGSHEIRFGTDLYWQNLNHEQPEFPGAVGPASGGFRFRSGATSRQGTATSDYNGFASFLLGLSQDSGRIVQYPTVYHTKTKLFSTYVRDRWQVNRRVTFTYGLRGEFYPFPGRDGRGLERFDFDNNQMLVCGTGSVPFDCGFKERRAFVAPRAGIAFRATDTMVVRAGYGLTIDPFNWARPLRTNYPVMFVQNLPLIHGHTRSWSATLDQGLPPGPPEPTGDILPMPLTAALITVDKNATRGYVQSWNLTIEKQLPGDWIVSAGYVATRSINPFSALDANWSGIGEGTAGRQLVKAYGRTATTTYHGSLGTAMYDSLQMRADRRFSRGLNMSVNWTWSHNRGYGSADSGGGVNVDIPEFWGKNRGPLLDYRHVLNYTGIYELPFGRGKSYAVDGPAAAVLGGWQFNWLSRFQTGAGVTPSASGNSLNAPGSGQFADCLGPAVKVGTVQQWWSPSSFGDPNLDPTNPRRFGTCGVGVLRGPGLINVDMGLFRKFRITESIDLQFRAEAFNVSNTPHFEPAPDANVSGSNFGLINALANTGREGLDQRVFRVGLRVGW
ncbi:MAG: TonB-dependent receptor [Bryobacteraceae bacterium]